jgi:FAD/FMN-containing dehydrogenase
VLELAVPQGWFPPVTPGTRQVTLGGALANDVHGKNHHVAGSFGHHVRAFELLRSDGTRLRCTPEENAEWFAATLGGLGLTGLVTWVELQLRRIPGPAMEVESVRFGALDEFFSEDAAQSDSTITLRPTKDRRRPIPERQSRFSARAYALLALAAVLGGGACIALFSDFTSPGPRTSAVLRAPSTVGVARADTPRSDGAIPSTPAAA